MGQEAAIRVMVVDDHSLIRDAFARIINGQHDMQMVAEASNGKDALHMLSSCVPDVILMDLHMPEMGGIEAMYSIRKQYPKPRFVVISSYGFEDEVEESFRAGADACLLKDAPRESLLETIRAIVVSRTAPKGWSSRASI